jgi:hypothetical protein
MKALLCLVNCACNAASALALESKEQRESTKQELRKVVKKHTGASHQLGGLDKGLVPASEEQK